MAPPSGAGKRVKGCQIFRPFIYGTTARPFDPEKFPKPPGVPEDHTHSWQVFVKGIDDTDITYWLRRVQFKLHESIPNHVRMIDAEPGKPFVVNETGWGEFEITLKLYYAAESSEKPQTLYHHLRLHPYGRTEAEKELMRAGGAGPGGVPEGAIVAWTYEEQLFNEPYEAFYDILTSGAMPASAASASGASKGGKSGGKSGKDRASSAAAGPTRSEGGVLSRSAMIPLTARPGHPFSRETEQLELARLKEAVARVDEMTTTMQEELRTREARLAKLKDENAAAVAAG